MNTVTEAPALEHAASRDNVWLHRYAVFVASCTALLVFAGGLVTSTDSGLSVPDWPLSYGELFPPMVGNVRFEHGHRMVATFVGMLTIVLAIWLQRREPRRNVRRLGWAALAAVVAQGLLGGLTVLLLLPPQISVAHACLGQTFFCISVAIALMTSAGWRRSRESFVVEPGVNIRTVSIVMTALVFAQLLLGALMRHTGAGLAIPDFPLAFGRLIPPFDAPGVALHFLHRVVGIIVACAAVATWIYISRRHAQQSALLQPARFVVALVLLQVLLGALTVWTQKGVLPTTFHVLNGALILASSLIVALRSFHLSSRDVAQHATFEPLVQEQVAS